MDPESQCPGCQIIADAMDGWSNGLMSDAFEVHLGTFAGFAERRDCNACQFVVQHFSTDPSCYRFRPSCCLVFSRVSFKGRFWIMPDVLCGRGLEDREPCEEPHGYLELTPSAALSPTMEHFIPVNPHWLDIQRIRLWPDYCDREHHGLCHTLSEWQTVDPAPFMILIDVEHQHLVRVSQPKRYLALSYVWGKIPDTLETTQDNLSQLQHLGALDSQPWASRLPATVRDAMSFTRLMGEQYLWVDRLCIIQDDHQHKAEQLSWMSSIYVNSYFTIIAADGDSANYGLRGVCASSLPRAYPLAILHFSSGCSMMRVPQLEDQFNVKEWHRRGWTFQERTLSNRNLIFFQDRVFWECRQSRWVEDLADMPDGVSASKMMRRKSDRYSFEFRRWPDLHQYSKLVSLYNNRLLTYQSDALQAFSAIIDVLSRSFEGGFIYGLPELYFDFGLLWRPNTPTRRRQDAGVGSSDFPSWSWVGWEGNVVLSLLKKSHQLLWDDGASGPAVEIYPTVTWFKVHRQTGEECRINNSYHLFQRMRNDPLAPLPAGWLRVKPSTKPAKEPAYSNGLWVFKHDGIQQAEFIHPVPIPPKPLSPNGHIWDNHLTFRTSRCFLFPGPILGTMPQRTAWSNIANDFVRYCLAFTLVDASGQWAGMIHSNFSAHEEVPLGERCEIVIISAGISHIDKNESVKY